MYACHVCILSISVSQDNVKGCFYDSVPMDLDVRMKAVLLGALFLIVSKEQFVVVIFIYIGAQSGPSPTL